MNTKTKAIKAARTTLTAVVILVFGLTAAHLHGRLDVGEQTVTVLAWALTVMFVITFITCIWNGADVFDTSDPKEK